MESILTKYLPIKILELGCGEHSTLHLARYCDERSAKLVSIEQNELDWMNKAKSLVSKAYLEEYVTFDMISYPDVIFNKYGRDFDFVFVDGLREMRALSVAVAMKIGIPVVAYHDSEMVWWYQWNNIEVPDTYVESTYMHRKYKANWMNKMAGIEDKDVPNKCTTVLVKKPFDPVLAPADHKRVRLQYDATMGMAGQTK